MATDPTVEQIRAFANALKGDIGPGFGQDVVALCDEVVLLRRQVHDMAIALREVGEDRNRLAAALSAEAGDKVPNAGPWPPTHWPAPGPSAEAGDTDDA
jgi:hypothetical protein